jgi:hypothetical protein
MIVLAPKAAAEMSATTIPSIARLWHIYKENEIEKNNLENPVFAA